LRSFIIRLAYPVVNAIKLVEAVARLPDELLECGDRLRVGRQAQNRAVAL